MRHGTGPSDFKGKRQMDVKKQHGAAPRWGESSRPTAPGIIQTLQAAGGVTIDSTAYALIVFGAAPPTRAHSYIFSHHRPQCYLIQVPKAGIRRLAQMNSASACLKHLQGVNSGSGLESKLELALIQTQMPKWHRRQKWQKCPRVRCAQVKIVMRICL